jgi:hypothetical protein
MSRINGEKARSAIAKSRRTAQRVKDRTRLAEIRAAKTANSEQAAPAEKPAKKSAPKAAAKSNV